MTYPSQQSKRRILLLFCLLGCIITNAQQEDSLVRELDAAKHDTVKIKILAQLAEICDNNKILSYAEPQKLLCEKAIAAKLEPSRFYLVNLASAINNIGFYYSKLGQPEKALENYKRALSTYETVKDTINAAYALNNIAFIYNNQGDVKTALDYFYRNLKLQEQIKDTTGIAYSLNNIAFAFQNQKDYRNAVSYFERSLAMFEAKNNRKGIAMVYGNMGTIYTDQNNKAKALEFYNKSLSIYESAGDQYSVSHELSGIAFEYAKAGEDSLALAYYQRALKIADQLQVKKVQAYASTGIAKILLKRNDVQAAQQYAVRSFGLAKEMGVPADIENAAGILRKIYVRQNNFRDAYSMYELELKMRDSVLNESTRKQASAKNLQYEYEKKELLLKIDNEKALSRRNILVLICLLVAIVSALFAFFYTRQNRLKSQLTRMELEQQQYRAQMNPHFIFNCMNSIQHYIVHNDVKAANKFLSQFAGLMRRTLDINKGHFISVEDEMNYLENYLLLEQMRFDGKFDYKVACSDTLSRQQVKLPTMMLQPFAENAIQHGLRYLSGNDGILTVSFKNQDNYLVCTIDDNGIGREAAKNFRKQADAHASQGVSLIENKLTVLNNIHHTDASLEIIDKAGPDGKAAGTTVVLKFPLKWK